MQDFLNLQQKKSCWNCLCIFGIRSKKCLDLMDNIGIGSLSNKTYICDSTTVCKEQKRCPTCVNVGQN